MIVGAFVIPLAGACGTASPDMPAAKPSTLSVSGAWARASDSGATTAVYFVLANSAAIADTIKATRSDAADSVGLHISMQHSGMMHMSELTALPVPANDSVSFRPLGAHVMLTGLRRPLAAGDSVDVWLDFVSGERLVVRAGVRTP